MSDPTSILAVTRGRCLRILAAHAPCHPRGITSAARMLRHRLPTPLQRRLAQLDIAFAVVRHVTERSCDDLVEALYAAFEVPSDHNTNTCSDNGGAENEPTDRAVRENLNRSVAGGDRMDPETFYIGESMSDAFAQTDLRLLEVALVTPLAYETHYMKGSGERGLASGAGAGCDALNMHSTTSSVAAPAPSSSVASPCSCAERSPTAGWPRASSSEAGCDALNPHSTTPRPATPAPVRPTTFPARSAGRSLSSAPSSCSSREAGCDALNTHVVNSDGATEASASAHVATHQACASLAVKRPRRARPYARTGLGRRRSRAHAPSAAERSSALQGALSALRAEYTEIARAASQEADRNRMYAQKFRVHAARFGMFMDCRPFEFETDAAMLRAQAIEVAQARIHGELELVWARLNATS